MPDPQINDHPHKYPVWVDPDSSIGDFTCGPFRGYASRREAREAKYRTNSSESDVPAQPECWEVVVGNDRAWRSVLLPLGRGRTLKKAIAEAVSLFEKPDDIAVVNSRFGATIDLRKTVQNPKLH